MHHSVYTCTSVHGFCLNILLNSVCNSFSLNVKDYLLGYNAM
jgi:hypothetical protein